MANELQERNPYVGPRPFEQRHKDLFFGRGRESSELLSLVIAHRAFLLYAPSGAGKTSLLNAGLIPLLKGEGFEVLPLARVQGRIPEDIQPEEVPNLYVLNTLISWAKDEANTRRLAQMSLVDFLRERKHPTDEAGLPAPRVAIFDQFEELFTFYPERWWDREGFFQQVSKALEADPLLRVLFVIREDHIAQLDPYVSLLPERLRTRYRLERLREGAALAAVKGPLRDTRHSFEEGVAKELVQELLKVRVTTAAGEAAVVTGEFVEPVQLQVVCRSLWRELPRDVTVITRNHLQTFGDVTQALSGFYERSIKRVARERRVKEGALRKWFAERLITPTETRGTVHRGRRETSGIPNVAVDQLEDLHLIRGEWRAGAQWYELTHDRFVEPIQKSNEAWRAARRGRWLRIAGSVMAVLILLFVGIAALQAIEDTYEPWQTWRVQATSTRAAWQSQATATVAAAEVSEAKATAQQSQTAATVAAAELSETKATATIEAMANEYIRQGFAYAEEGDYEQAISEYTKAIELSPDYAPSYYNRAFAYRGLGNYNQAIADFTKAIQLDYDPLSWPYNSRGITYRLLGDYEQAIADYTKAIELDADYAKAYNNRGYAYRKLRDYKQAIADYTKAIELDPDYALAYTNRGLAYADQGEYDLAIADYTKAIELNPDYAEAYNGRGWAHSQLEDYERAFQEFEKSIEVNPDSPWVYYHRGLTYDNLGDRENAIADLEMALQLTEPPLDEDALDTARATLERLRGQ